MRISTAFQWENLSDLKRVMKRRDFNRLNRAITHVFKAHPGVDRDSLYRILREPEWQLHAANMLIDIKEDADYVKMHRRLGTIDRTIFFGGLVATASYAFLATRIGLPALPAVMGILGVTSYGTAAHIVSKKRGPEPRVYHAALRHESALSELDQSLIIYTDHCAANAILVNPKPA